MIDYRHIARVRMELENILLLIGELEKKGIEKSLIVDIILNEHERPNSEDERFGEN